MFFPLIISPGGEAQAMECHVLVVINKYTHPHSAVYLLRESKVKEMCLAFGVEGGEFLMLNGSMLAG